jgi:rRNA maturation protein Nop10
VAETHLDHPGEVTWFEGYGPKRPLGLPCNHPCDHNFSCSVIAWGPDYEHYCIVECKECGCRSWTVEYPPPFSPERPKYQRRSLVQMAAESPRPDAGSVLLVTLLLGLLVAGLLSLAFLAGEQRRCDALREQGSALVERYCGTEAGG